MLETIKASIVKISNFTSFEQFYDSHVMAVQDDNIITEIKYNVDRNRSTVLDVERLAHHEHERLVNSH